LTQRGEVHIGYHADLVLFDPARVRDTATFDKPLQQADGIDAVWVNGVLSYRDGQPTGERAGHFVARGEASKADAHGAF
jgi:N-acyl-D-aspartate/D-glutamate deacylase